MPASTTVDTDCSRADEWTVRGDCDGDVLEGLDRRRATVGGEGPGVEDVATDWARVRAGRLAAAGLYGEGKADVGELRVGDLHNSVT